MKMNITKLMICASAGTLLQTGALAGGDTQIKIDKDNASAEISTDTRYDENNYGTASQRFGETSSGLSRDRTPRQGQGAEDLTRTEQRLNNPGGHAASGSFANSIERNNINEDKRMEISADTRRINSDAKDSTVRTEANVSRHRAGVEVESDLNRDAATGDRRPRQGLGSEDLTQNEEKVNGAQSESFINEAAGAEARNTTDRSGSNLSGSTKENNRMGQVHRASDMIGMEVKTAQGERVGEIKDLVLDIQSGRVSYALVSAGGDRLYAVPPSVLTRGTDDKTLVFNSDKELKSAPGFEKNNWSQANNQKFTTEVYRHYQQQPYWQSSREIREPAGAVRDGNQNQHP